MAEIPDFPLPDPAFAPLTPLWESARTGVFTLPRCGGCGRFDWYPTEACSACGSKDNVWAPLSGRGTLFSFAIVHRALHRPLAVLGSYVSAIVAIEEDPRTRFVTRIVDADPDTLRCDMPVEATFADAGYPAFEAGFVVPLFTPRAA